MKDIIITGQEIKDMNINQVSDLYSAIFADMPNLANSTLSEEGMKKYMLERIDKREKDGAEVGKLL